MMDKLERALREGGGLFTMDDLLERIADGRFQSFTRNDSWIVTQINNYPRRKLVDVVVGCGNMHDIMFLENKLSQFAGHIEADGIVMNGRKGWLKMQDLFDDWKPLGSRYIKEIANGRPRCS